MKQLFTSLSDFNLLFTGIDTVTISHYLYCLLHYYLYYMVCKFISVSTKPIEVSCACDIGVVFVIVFSLLLQVWNHGHFTL